MKIEKFLLKIILLKFYKILNQFIKYFSILGIVFLSKIRDYS